MALIHLTRGCVAIVDDDDSSWLSGFASWSAKPVERKRGGFYAFCTRSGTTLYMHRMIVAAERGQVVDHINGDGLDNRRSNLRLATPSQNNANRDQPPNASGYRGVYPHHGGFYAAVWSGGERRVLGYYPTAEEAAAVYDAAAIEMFGEFARPNFSTGAV